jgi:hypothetical protein
MQCKWEPRLNQHTPKRYGSRFLSVPFVGSVVIDDDDDDDLPIIFATAHFSPPLGVL